MAHFAIPSAIGFNMASVRALFDSERVVSEEVEIADPHFSQSRRVIPSGVDVEEEKSSSGLAEI